MLSKGATSGDNNAEIVLIASNYPHMRSTSNNQYKINTDNDGYWWHRGVVKFQGDL